MIFLDTSALVKAYVTEQGSPSVRAVMQRLGGQLFPSKYVALELLATLGKQFRTQGIARREYIDARTKFLAEFPTSFRTVEIVESILQSAFALADQYRHMSVGAMDLLHAATALELQARAQRRNFVVVSSDQRFLMLAQACGLQTFDPETQPFGTLLALYGWHDAN